MIFLIFVRKYLLLSVGKLFSLQVTGCWLPAPVAEATRQQHQPAAAAAYCKSSNSQL